MHDLFAFRKSMSLGIGTSTWHNSKYRYWKEYVLNKKTHISIVLYRFKILNTNKI